MLGCIVTFINSLNEGISVKDDFGGVFIGADRLFNNGI